jgi:ribonuclease T1
LGVSAFAREAAPPIPDVAAAELPKEARDTLALIKTGGPFRYRRDGSRFGNIEKRLPARSRGYYREYTVPTPGARDRGARRIVAGAGADGDVRTSGEYYYTDDHYVTFRRIRE